MNDSSTSSRFSLVELAAADLPRIAEIDRSETVVAKYDVAADGLALRLIRTAVRPPRELATWGEREIVGRCVLWRENLSAGAAFYAAVADAHLIGIASLLLRSVNAAELLTLHVSRPWRGRGVGSALLNRAEEKARAWRAQRLFLHTGSPAGAIEFYVARGFHLAGVDDNQAAAADPNFTFVRNLQEPS